MTLTLTQSATALSPNSPASFRAIDGLEPYVYSVISTYPGGVIDPDTGAYIAPSAYSSVPQYAYDMIQVTDANNDTASAQILVGNALMLFCDIIQSEMNLNPGRVYLWNQKLMQPVDAGLYVAVSQAWCKCIANVNELNGTEQNQFVAMMSQMDVNVISRGPLARDRKEEVLMALKSIYSTQQQHANGFKIGTVPTGFIDLSRLDGAAIPYRFQISVALQYVVEKPKAADYYDTFSDPILAVNT